MFPNILSSVDPLEEKLIFLFSLGIPFVLSYLRLSSIFKLSFSRPSDKYMNGVSALNGKITI